MDRALALSSTELEETALNDRADLAFELICHLHHECPFFLFGFAFILLLLGFQSSGLDDILLEYIDRMSHVAQLVFSALAGDAGVHIAVCKTLPWTVSVR